MTSNLSSDPRSPLDRDLPTEAELCAMIASTDRMMDRIEELVDRTRILIAQLETLSEYRRLTQKQPHAQN